MKKFYIVYEIEAEDINQAKAVSLEMFNQTKIKPKALLEKTDFNQIQFVNDIKN